MNLKTIWHCPRPALAKSYLSLLSAGPVVSATIFAPRRTGKTAFLRQDLTPAARDAGFIVAYADLWQTRMSPGLALIHGLEEAIPSKPIGQRTMDRLRHPVKSVRAKASLGGAEGELGVDFADPKAEMTELALKIDALIATLSAKKPLLLLVDEAQELARNRENELVATALRTAITKHRDRVRVVFTGSSRTKLAHVFSSTDAPLYSVGASIQDFPLLGRELVEFIAAKFNASTGRSLNVENGWAEFQLFNRQPEPFLNAVVTIMLDPGTTLEQACADERERQDQSENHEGTWASLDALQKQLVMLFAENPAAKPFSKGVLTRLSKSLGVSRIDAPAVQFSIRKLAESTIVSKSASGIYVFESNAFERWVKTLAPGIEDIGLKIPRLHDLARPTDLS